MKPIIGITLGEPKGIGPEVVVKALDIEEVHMLCHPVIVGPIAVLRRTMDLFGLDREVKEITKDEIEEFDFNSESIALIDTTSENSVLSTLESIKVGTKLCQDNLFQAVVTGPIDKHRINKEWGGKKKFVGHTEYLQELTASKRVAMMLVGENLKVVPVTGHCALREVADRLSIQNISAAIELTSLALKSWFNIGEPRIAVSALNPHGGEKGLFGHEEDEFILPAIEKCRLNGIDVVGPHPADTLFYHAVMKKKYDAVVAMYHDQALIPLKLLHFQSAVNVTLGIPIVRTSVDHGTAYDLVGKRVADPSSMVEAIRLAAQIARNI